MGDGWRPRAGVGARLGPSYSANRLNSTFTDGYCEQLDGVEVSGSRRQWSRYVQPAVDDRERERERERVETVFELKR